MVGTRALCVFFVFLGVVCGHETGGIPQVDVLKILRNVSYSGVSEVCARDFNDYVNGISDAELWALRMFDSITKIADGVLMGRSQIPGHFDECVQANNGRFKGKHCMVRILVDTSGNELREQLQLPKMAIEYGFCMPSTCSARDLMLLLKSVPEFNFYKFHVTDNDCSTDEFRPLRTEDWVTLWIIIIIILLALASTVYELTQKMYYKNDKPHQLWSSFSLYSGGKQLFSISHSGTQLKCLHGIRFLSMTWVILGHAYFSYIFGVAINKFDIPKIMREKSFVPIGNALVSVDSFFFLSGLLVCIVFFRDIAKKGYFDVPVAFIHRYIRLTPPFALLTLVQATIVSRIGNGPFWNARADNVESVCRRGWWTGMLYVQNYVDEHANCLGQAWYLSADMQMFWVSPLFLYPILWFPSAAPILMLAFVLAATITDFSIVLVNQFNPSFSLNFLSEKTWDQFRLEYIPFHTRMAPWLIGLATGYIICGMQAKKIRLNLSKTWVLAGWAACFALLGGSLYGILAFHDTDYTDVESAFYLAFHRVGWALGLAWIVIACIAGYGGPVNHLLSLDVFQPLAKLSYCNFLIHMAVQNYRVNTSRTNNYIRHFEMVYAYFGDLILSHLLSIPVVLLFEYPFSQLDRYFLQGVKIFPLSMLGKKEDAVKEEKVEKPAEVPAEVQVESGKVNPGFSAS